MASSVWSGYLTFGLISMPVRLFSGARGNHISFHMLHRDDNTRIKQQLWCPHDERVVERNEIVKGYEYRKGEYVIIEPEEIKKIEPKTAKAMEILEFVKADDVDPIYFESSYYVTPDEAGRRPYALLCKALEETSYVAIAKLTMHNREYTVVLLPPPGLQPGQDLRRAGIKVRGEDLQGDLPVLEQRDLPGRPVGAPG